MDAFESIKHAVKQDLQALDQLIVEELASNEPLVEKIGHHIIRSGGKRLRPLLSLLSANLFNLSTKKAVLGATLIEFIHTATLLHDDVVDHAPMRRGKQSAHRIWGSEASVLVGDFLYSRAFQLMVRLNNMPIMRLLAKTTNTIAEGEVMQLAQAGNPTLTEAHYLKIITAKTATLFAAAAQIAPMILERDPSEIQACAEYGHHLGLAFQLVDDAIDYQQENPHTGKIPLNDWHEGKLTLPLIHTLQHATAEEKAFLEETIAKPQANQLRDVLDIIIRTGGIEHTYKAAEAQAQQAHQALASLNDAYDCTRLAALVEFSIQRNY